MRVEINVRKTFDINDDVRGVLVLALKNALWNFSHLEYREASSVFEALHYKRTADNMASVRTVIQSALASVNPESVFSGRAEDIELLEALKESWDTKPLAYVWPILLDEALRDVVAEGLPMVANNRKGIGDWLWDSFR